jgi:hypothetical protein
MHVVRVSLLFCFAFLLAFTSLTWAQATSQIQGSIQDSSGASVPGAVVKATQTETGLSRSVTSNAEGEYILSNLPVGPYQLDVSKEGFTTYVQRGIVLQVSTNPTIDITMKVGAVNEQVQVEANAAMVETQATGVGQVIENQRILELPLNGRQATDLIQLAGAAIPQGAASSRSMNGGQAISVAGGQSFGVSYLLDGALHSNPFDNLNLPLPFPDALQEFKLETSSLTAQNGMHAGAAVNAVTRSGTNEIHGDLFEFLRNGDLNGRNFFASRSDSLKRNQFGGTAGLPIIKNKLFAFGGYQGTRTRQDPSDQLAFIPTAQMLQGDLTTFASAGCQSSGRALTLRAPFVNNQIAPSQVDPIALKIAAKLPATSDPCGRILFGSVVQQNEYQAVGRTDYQLSDKQTIFARYMATSFFQAVPYSIQQNLLNTIQGGRDNLAQSVTIGDTYLISSTTVNSYRATVNRTAIHRTNADFFSAPDLGINTFSYLPHYMLLTITNGFSIGGGTENEATFRTTTYQMSDDVTMIRGKHQIGFGLTASQWRSNGYANVRSPGQFTIAGNATGSGLADFLTGQLNGTTSSFLQSAPNTLIDREWYVGAYLQDSWKVTPRLTINAGLRWEPWFPIELTNGAVYNFDLSRFQQGIKSTVFKNGPAGFRFPGDAGFQDHSGMNRKWLDLGPRVGIAWDPRGNGRFSIRASYGLSYDYVNGQFFINTAVAPPFGSETRILGTAPFANPFLGSGLTNIFPITFDQNAPFSLAGPFITLKPDQKTTGTHAWNLTIQKQIGASWLLAASYIGNETQHLWVSTQSNPAVYIPGNCVAGQYGLSAPGPCSTTNNTNARRALSLAGYPDAKYIGFLDVFDDGGTASYQGLLLSAQRRLSNHVSFSGNYTWSHCVGDATQGGSTPNVGTGYVDPNNRRFDRGACASSAIAALGGTDRRHIANFTVVAETPGFSNKKLRLLATGWRISGIYRVTSGAPFTVTLPGDTQLSGTTGQRPNQILGDPYCAHQNTSCWINPAAFATPAAGTLGNMGKYNVLGPGFWQIDMALSRIFKIRERINWELRGEAFNLSNSMRPGSTVAGTYLQTNIGTNTFGQITSALDPRIVQVAMKVVF